MSRLLLEYTLQEVAPGDALVKQIAHEFADLFEQCQKEGVILTEGDLGNTQIKAILNGAARVSQGKKLEKGKLDKTIDAGKQAGKAIKGGVLATAQGAAKLNKGFDNLVKKYEGKEGVTEFNNKADKAMAKIGAKVRKVKGGDSAIKVLKKLGEWGKENPGKQAIALGALAAVGGFMSGGAIPAVAVPLYKAITAGAAGDKVTTIIAKAAKGAALGAVAGAAGDALGGGIADAIEGLNADQLTEIKQDLLNAAQKGSMDDIEAAYGVPIPEIDAGIAYSVNVDKDSLGVNFSFKVFVPEDKIDELESLTNVWRSASSDQEEKEALIKWYKFMKEIDADPNNSEMYDAAEALHIARQIGLSSEDIEGLDLAEKTLADKAEAINDAVKNAKSGVENAAYSRGSDSKTLDRNN